MASAEQQAQDLIASLLRDARAEGKAEGRAEGRAETLAEIAAYLSSLGAPQILKLPLRPATPSNPQAGRLFQEAMSEAAARRPRGQNRELVLKTLELMAMKMGATEIQRLLSSENLAYSSVRNALSQLVAEGKVIEHPGGLFEAKIETAPADVARAAE